MHLLCALLLVFPHSIGTINNLHLLLHQSANQSDGYGNHSDRESRAPDHKATSGSEWSVYDAPPPPRVVPPPLPPSEQ